MPHPLAPRARIVHEPSDTIGDRPGLALRLEAAEALELLIVLPLLVSVDANFSDPVLVRGGMELAAMLGLAIDVAEVIRAGEPVTLEFLEAAITPGRGDLVS